MFSFKIIHKDKLTQARTGLLTTPHGSIHTPAFFPVGTQASIKGLTPEEIKESRTEGIFVNTYHLYLRPGGNVIKNLGGLHKFMNWSGPIMTDSAGYQVFSLGFGIEHEVGKMINLFGNDLVLGDLSVLSNLNKTEKSLVARTKLCKIEDEGPTFVSHLDGSVHFFPPEKSVQVQIALGADLIVALDECTSPLHDYDYTKAAMERTHRWEARSLTEFKKQKLKYKKKPAFPADSAGSAGEQEIYCVIQGGPFRDLREKSTKYLAGLDFFGMGIGGALVSKQTMKEILEWIHPFLPEQKPRHLFGIGSIDDIFAGVERGVDTFDCVMPTRLGRMGQVLFKVKSQKSKVKTLNNNQIYTYKEDKFRLDITKTVFLDDKRPIDPECACYACKNYSRGYLCHLFRAKELLAYRLATIHNLFFMQAFMKEIREAINENRLNELKKEWGVS